MEQCYLKLSIIYKYIDGLNPASVSPVCVHHEPERISCTDAVVSPFKADCVQVEDDELAS